MTKKHLIIYKISINDEFYIGSTSNLSTRINQHKFNILNPTSEKYNLPVYKYIREHGGFSNIKWDIIVVEEFNGNLSDQKITEQNYIDWDKPTLNVHKAFQIYKNKKEYDKIRYEQKKIKKPNW